MDLSRSTLSSRPVEDDEEEDEDEDDCVVTHVVLAPGRNTVIRWNSPAAAGEGGGGGGGGGGGCGEGLQRSEDSECASSLASFVGVKKERAENGALYVLLEVNEKQEQEDSEKQEEEEDGSQAQTHDKCVQEENLHCVEQSLMLQESCEDDENQQVLIQQEEEPQKKEEEEENREKRPTVDLTPFLSFLSDCIRESKADQTRSCSNKSIPDDDDSDGEDVFGRGSGINFAGSVTAGGMSDCRVVEEEEEEEEIIAAVVTTVPTEEENFLHDGDGAADQAVVVKQPLYPPAPPPPHVPGAASRDVSSSEPAAAAAEDDHEENIARIQDCVDCYDGSDHEGYNNGRSFVYGGFEEADDDDTGFEEDDTRVQEAAEHQEQVEEEDEVQCVGTDSSEEQQQLLQQQQHAGRDEDHDSAKEQEQQIQGISLDHMALHQAVSSNLQTSSSKAAPLLGVRRTLLQARSMFDSWCEIGHIKKAQILSLGGGGARATVSSVVAEFQKPSQVFESSNSRFLSKCPLEDDSSSSPACSSQSHTVLPPGWLRMISKPGSEISYIDPHVRRRRTSQDMKPPPDKAATAEGGPGGESALCSSSIEAEPEEDIVRSQKSEEEEAFKPDMMIGISTVAVATTKYYHHHDHHFKPNCRAPKNRSCTGTSNSPRKVPVMKRKEFKYVESWKGLMPTNGQDPDNERQKVIQALYTFEELRKKLREAEELRVAKGRAEGLTCLKRPDLKAATEMRLRGLQVNTNEYIGNIPGIGVGDRFWYRIEMVVIGLHKQLEAGIAFISKTKARVRAHSGTSVATSIVMKHWGNPYRDDIDNGEFITYTGQGGLSARSSTAHCIADQVLTRGNEALKNSYKGHWPIRVIRGDRDKKSPTGEVYTYIGLYQILHMRYEPGKDGNLVYMFDLKRQGGQQPLPICASPEPNRHSITNKPGSSTSMTVKRKWEDLPHAGGDNVASSPYSSSRGQWGIPLDFSNTNQTLYVRGSS